MIIHRMNSDIDSIFLQRQDLSTNKIGKSNFNVLQIIFYSKFRVPDMY